MAKAVITGTSFNAISTPASGDYVLGFDSTGGILAWKDSAGRMYGYTKNAATAAQGAGFASDTYVTNSDILIPSWGFQTKTIFRWALSCSKSAASTATPIYTIRIGSARTTADTSRLALTGPAQTAIADIGTLFIDVVVRSVGASGVIQGTAAWLHRGTAASTTVSGVGFANDTTGHVEGTSAGFDMTTGLAGNYIGLSINGGTSSSWTFTQCTAEADW